MDFATLVITLFALRFFYFGTGSLSWSGTSHYALHIDRDTRKASALQRLLLDNSSYKSIAEASEHIRSELNALEDGCYLRLPRETLSTDLSAIIAPGDLTLTTLLQLIGETEALSITNTANNQYDVSYRFEVSRGMSRFFDTVAELIRILRSPYYSQKNTSFIVRFHPLSSRITSIAPISPHQSDPGFLIVRGAPIGMGKSNGSIDNIAAHFNSAPHKTNQSPADTNNVRRLSTRNKTVCIDYQRKDVRVGTTWCGLNNIEFALFRTLEQYAGQTCGYKQLNAAVDHYTQRGRAAIPTERQERSMHSSINAYIGKLRRKLAALMGNASISFISGRGYRYDGPPASVSGYVPKVAEPTKNNVQVKNPSPSDPRPTITPQQTRPKSHFHLHEKTASAAQRHALDTPKQNEPRSSATQKSNERTTRRYISKTQSHELACGITREGATIDGSPLSLSGIHFGILQYLIQHASEIVSPQRLYAAIYGARSPRYEEIIEHDLEVIRNKLHDNNQIPKWIECIPSGGFQFVGTPAPVEPPEQQNSSHSEAPDHVSAALAQKPGAANLEETKEEPSSQQSTNERAASEPPEIKILADRHDIALNGRSLHLAPEEYLLLLGFLSHPNSAITNNQIQRLYSAAHPNQTSQLAHLIFIGQLRLKLDDNPSRSRYIVAAPGEGYRFIAHVNETITNQARSILASLRNGPKQTAQYQSTNDAPSISSQATEDTAASDSTTSRYDDPEVLERISHRLLDDWYPKEEFASLVTQDAPNLTEMQTHLIVPKLGFCEYRDCMLRVSAGSLSTYYSKYTSEPLVPFNNIPETLQATPSFIDFIDEEYRHGRLLLYDDTTWMTRDGLHELGITPGDISSFVVTVLKCCDANRLACVTIPWLKRFANDTALLGYGLSDRFYESVLDTRESICRGKLCGTALFARYKHNARGDRLVTSLVETEKSMQLDDLLDELNEDFGIPITRQRLIPLIRNTTLYFSLEADRVYANHAQFVREVK